MDGDADPCGVSNGGGDRLALCGVNYQCEDIGAEDAEEDGDDLGHALAPYIEADDYCNGDNGNEPVAAAVVYRGGGQRQADGDDDGAGDDGREEAHDLLDAELFEQSREQNIHQTRNKHAEAGVGEKRVIKYGRPVSRGADGADGVVAADEREGAAEEGGNLALGDQVEEQRADAGEQKRGGDVQTGQRRDKNGRAEHGEHMLQAKQQHLGRTEGTRVINGAVNGGFLFFHSIYLSL